MKQATTRIEDNEYELFQKTADSLGTTTADVLRMFIYAFNDHHGFPYEVKSQRMIVEAFNNEEEADDFITDLSMKEIL